MTPAELMRLELQTIFSLQLQDLPFDQSLNPLKAAALAKEQVKFEISRYSKLEVENGKLRAKIAQLEATLKELPRHASESMRDKIDKEISEHGTVYSTQGMSEEDIEYAYRRSTGARD